MDRSQWYHDGIDYALKHDLMQGTGETTFEPDATVSRAMLVTVLYRMEGQPAVSSSNRFTDVEDSQWYTDAVLWAENTGIVQGYGDGRFGTNDPIKREQLTAILFRYTKMKGYYSVQSTSLAMYTDYMQMSEYAIPTMQWAVAARLFVGFENTLLSPQSDTTRAQLATVLMHYRELYNLQ